MRSPKLNIAIQDARNSYHSGGPSFTAKATYHAAGRRELRKTAKLLGCTEFNVRSCEGGPGVLGEVILHTPTLYIQICANHDPPVMYRGCDGMEDYTGGVNHWGQLDVLENKWELKRVSSFHTPYP